MVLLEHRVSRVGSLRNAAKLIDVTRRMFGRSVGEQEMKQYLPFVVGGMGLILLVVAMILKNGTPDAEAAITSLASIFMMLAGAVCVLVGALTFFLRDDEQVW